MPESGEVSKWLAAHSPVIVTAQRKDFAVAGTLESAGGGYVAILTSLDSSEITVGSYVYINSWAVVGVYEVLSRASTTNFVIDLAYSADTTGGYVNAISDRPNYRIYTSVQVYDPTASEYVDFDASISRPFTNGVAKIDVTRFCKNAVNMTDAFSHSQVNEKDTNLSAKIKLTFTEIWDDSDKSGVEGDELFLANAAMQIGHRFSSNMADFVPEPTGADKAKFLSASTKLRYYEGYPFDISFIYSELLTDESLKIYEDRYTANSVVSSFDDDLADTEEGYVNRVMLEGSYAETVEVVRFYIGIPQGDDPPIRLTEYGYARNECVRRNPVYLKWINANGGWNYFMFTGTQARGLKTSSLGIFSKFISDLYTAEGDGEYLGKEAVPELTLGAEQLDSYDVELIESLISSTKVMMLTNPDTWADTLEVWQTVKIEPGTIATKITKNTLNKIEFKMLLPELQIQTQ